MAKSSLPAPERTLTFLGDLHKPGLSNRTFFTRHKMQFGIAKIIGIIQS